MVCAEANCLIASSSSEVVACEGAAKSAGLCDIEVNGTNVKCEEEATYSVSGYSVGPGDGENVCCAALVHSRCVCVCQKAADRQVSSCGAL